MAARIGVTGWQLTRTGARVRTTLTGRGRFQDTVIRESIDGATMYELVAAVENWEPQPWLTPWTPKT